VRKREFLFSLGAATIATAIFWPIFGSGLYSDDMLSALLVGTIKMENSSFWGVLAEQNRLWFSRGRLFPLTLAWTDFTWYFLGWSPIYSKVASILSLFLAIGITALLTFRLTRSKRAAYLTLLLIPVSIQVRIGNDPLLSYPTMIPMVLIIVLCQGLLVERYVRIGDWRIPVALGLVFGIGLLFYELSIVGIAAAAAIALGLRLPLKKWPQLFVPSLLALAVYGSVAAAIRTKVGYVGIEIGPDAAAILKSFARNLFAAIPLGYWAVEPYGIRVSAEIVKVLVLASAFAAAYWAVLKSAVDVETGETSLGTGALVGLVLIIGASAVFALSKGYQENNARLDQIHLQSLMISFGTGIVLSCVISSLKAPVKFAGAAKFVFAIMLGLMAAVSYVGSSGVIEIQSKNGESELRAKFIEALRDGLLDAVADGSTVDVSGGPIWLLPDIVPMYTSKRINMVRGTEPAVYSLDVRSDPIKVRPIR
jgi:hypothetical protein